MWLIISIIAIIVLAVWGIIKLIFAKKKKINRLSQSLAMSLFLVRMPKYEKKEPDQQKQDFKALIEQMEQVYSCFLYLKKPSFREKRFGGYTLPRVALEIASKVGEADIAFYVAVPDYMEAEIEKGIQGVFPQAVVEKVPQDYTVFEPQAKVAGRRVFLKDRLYFPVKTYKNLERDPLSSITNALSKIKPEEGSAIQIILKPSSLDIKKKEEKILSEVIERGRGIRVAMAQTDRHWFLALLFEAIDLLGSSSKKQQKEQDRQSKETQKERTANDALIQAIKAKAQKPIFDINIRLVGMAGEMARAQEIADHLAGAFAQFSTTLNSFHPVKIKKRWLKRFVYDFSFRNYNQKEKIVLNLEELSSVYHFPLIQLETPNIKWAKTKESAPPPTGLSSEQSVGLNLIGASLFRGEEKPIYFMSRDDRRRHFYIVGQTGTGKSNLLREMIRQDIENGEGVAVIDPNGDLIEDTLANVPKERVDDVVLFEPFDMARPCGLNMLEWKSPEQKDFAISEMIMIFTKLFPPEIIGPMFEHYMRNAMLVLTADKEDPGTLVDIPRIFTDKSFMESKLVNVSDPLVKVFWEKEWAQTTGQTRSDMLGYVVSKVGRFVENEMMRNIIGQARNTFDLEEIMNNKKIFLANLSKGLTGEMNASLLGLILVSKMQIAAFRRGAMAQEERKDFYLYIDEFQNFTTDSIAIILSEARKYRLNLILAHQFMPQLTEQIRNAVIGNVGSIACFRVGALDAEFLEKQFEPEFSRFDLLNIDNFQFIIKMMLNNTLSSAFKVRAIKAKEGDMATVPLVKQLSKLKYARPRDIVEREIHERINLTF